MITKLDPEIIKAMKEGNADDRKYIAEKEFLYFAVYYFPQFFTHGIPPFHFEMYQDLKEMDEGNFKYLLWVMFRESAKTSLAKLYVIWCICFEKKHYINFDSYDKGNAEAALFDIASALNSNSMLIRDFGHLYRESRTAEKKTMKKMQEFITVNDIKVQAFSTQESTRGRLFGEFRPDLYIFDDIENSKTIESPPVIRKIKKHLKEALAGMSNAATAIILGNLISEAGVVNYLVKKAESSKSFKYHRVDIEMEGKIMWPQKYVHTRDEAIERNKSLPPEEQVASLEQKQEDLGRIDYAKEMLNSPEAAGDLVFDRPRVELMMKLARKPREIIADFKIWEKYDPGHRYALGADTAKGVGKDHNATVILDFSTTPCRVVATYKNNLIAPDTFAFEIKNQGLRYGECLVCPEINNTGYATVTQLKAIYDIGKIWRMNYGDKKPKANDKPTMTLGWEANSATVPEIIYQLKKAVEDGLLEIPDLGLLKELRDYSQVDLQDINPQIEGDEEEDDMSRHFDLLRACAIAWKMKDYAEVAQPKQGYVQPVYESTSAYETPRAVETNTVDGQNKFSFDPFEGNPYDPFSRNDQM